MIAFLSFVCLYLVAIVLLKAGYRDAGKIFERNFNTIDGVKGSGVLAEGIVVTLVTILSFISVAVAKVAGATPVNSMRSLIVFAGCSAGMIIISLVYATTAGPRDVLSGDKTFQAMPDGEEKKKDESEFRRGYFIYGLFSGVFLGGICLIGVFAFAQMIVADVDHIARISENLPVLTDAPLDELTGTPSMTTSDAMRSAMYCEDLLEQFQVGLRVVQKMMSRYLLIAGFLCIVLFLISTTSIWRVYTRKALVAARVGVVLLLLVVVPVIVGFTFKVHSEFVRETWTRLTDATARVYHDQQANSDLWYPIERVAGVRAEIFAKATLGGFLKFLFGSGGMLVVAMQVFALGSRNLLRKEKFSEMIMADTKHARVLRSVLLRTDTSADSYWTTGKDDREKTSGKAE